MSDGNAKIGLVTGANRGIGLEIVRQLAKAGFTVILTSRDEQKGASAVKQLGEAGVHAAFHTLDVAQRKSIETVAHYVGEQFGRLDLLVNNAGIIGTKKNIAEDDAEEIRRVMETNYFGPLALIQAMLPYLKKSKDARIINVSSGIGAWNDLNGDYASYRLSKVGLNSLTLMFAGSLRTDGIRVNSMCPGWVKTEMGGPGAPRTVEQGADTALWLATAPDIPTGKFFRDRREISW